MEKILVVVDMQKDFVDGALGTMEAAGIVDAVVSRIRNFEGRIFATMDTQGENYLETEEGKRLPVPHCISGTPGWKLDGRVQEALLGKNFKIIEKPTFGSTALVEELRRIQEQEEIAVELLGLCTDICVVSNALLLKAHFPEMPVCVNEACCAGVTPKTHKAALETMKMCQIDVI